MYFDQILGVLFSTYQCQRVSLCSYGHPNIFCFMQLIKKPTEKDKFEVPPEGVHQLLHVDQHFLFIFRCFLLISGVKSLKKVENCQKRLKTAEKSSLTSFRVWAAPKSWSKYTTIIQFYNQK